MLDGVRIFFENQFVEAQRVFATQDQVNPVYALGSGSLAFMKGTFFEHQILKNKQPRTEGKDIRGEKSEQNIRHGETDMRRIPWNVRIEMAMVKRKAPCKDMR